ncbi:MAG: tetratricopeptide repeat protein [Victivallaceae bacterium]|nr:tetratricopeptide repeat protein [Victivallaceae bacterium]MDD4181344.1 tetratricopeptide repeat protein [Victivallaceae bacterium]
MKTLFSICIVIGSCFFTYGMDLSEIQALDQLAHYARALELCKKTPSDAFSLYFIGDYLYHGRKGINRDQNLGREFYRKAIPVLSAFAENGNILAQYYLARCHEYGDSNLKLAREWYLKAAESGNSKAMCKAAMFVAKRKGGGEKNPDKVMGYINKAIEAGEPDGKALLASYYLESRKNIEKGIQLAKEAAAAGSPLGQMIVGGIYSMGMGSVVKDEGKAIEFLKASSDQGNSMANEVLSQLKEKVFR